MGKDRDIGTRPIRCRDSGSRESSIYSITFGHAPGTIREFCTIDKNIKYIWFQIPRKTVRGYGIYINSLEGLSTKY